MFNKFNRRILRLIQKPPQLAYKLGLGPILGQKVFLLTTTGRKSGLPRVIPLQYEMIDNVIQTVSAKSEKADWFRNIQADPHVKVEMGQKKFNAIAETSAEPEKMADYIFHKLENHPVMTRLIFLLENIPMNPERSFILDHVSDKAMIFIHPE